MNNTLDLTLSLPAGNLQAYLLAVNGYPMLSVAEERELAERLQRENDRNAAWRLVTSHLRLVAKIARGYRGYGLPEGDVIQEGNVGLMKAVKRFDPAVGVRLAAFAVHWIRAEIHEFILRNWRIIKVATTKAQRKLFFNLRRAKKRLGWFSHSEVKEVAEELGVSTDEALEMERRLSAHDTAYDGTEDQDDDTGHAAPAPATYLEDDRFEPAALVDQSDWEARNSARLHGALAKLDERSLDIISRRWLNEKKATLHDLAEQYGVSAERVRQIETNAMNKLRQTLAATS